MLVLILRMLQMLGCLSHTSLCSGLCLLESSQVFLVDMSSFSHKLSGLLLCLQLCLTHRLVLLCLHLLLVSQQHALISHRVLG